ncbi:hypothetical protein CH251_06240 [Rhodococcus sp. 06-462-5]|uniref:hypothetical protein n=1 Tax=unclassified Rhodococcus (in: high G+C Gram-positive bacteria) TaxID=192944 RepID=UPI000B9B304D|nr:MULTISPECIES: hypothetical protein [unclassified Rhodococcus (in: high G+C Gram-positive bacteria)]OZC76494.1 hypothetical protein CH251_06240 [Rhodococcus sp. 06-462-5]OZE64551.1 hypothetical protein CH270_15980 [Rhodococcus sp. 02-925g]
MTVSNPRTIRVFVAAWVIQDGSFPRASVGDVADVVVEHHTSDAPSVCDDSLTAIARPAFGRAPVEYRDGRLRWLHLVYGDGWSSRWSADESTNGPVTLTGVFSACLDDRGIDDPPHVRGRITRMHLVHKQVRPTENGWTGVDGTDRLTELDRVPISIDWWPTQATKTGDHLASGILVELDLDDALILPTRFVAGAVATDGDTVWVMHSSDPVLLRVDTAGSPTITKYVLPLTIEPPTDRWTRRIHAIDGGCWITSEHDIHRCILDPNGVLSIDRLSTEGGGISTVHDGRLYLVGSSRSFLRDDRRHRTIRTHPDTPRLRVLNETERRIEPIDGPADVQASRADRATGADGTQWWVDGTNTLRRIDVDGSTTTVDLSDATAIGVVRPTTPDVFTDPANADVVGPITVDIPRLVRKAE